MKNFAKYLFTFILSFVLLTGVAFAEEDKKEKSGDTKEKVTLYLFRQTGCPHCADEMLHLDKIYKDLKKNFNIVVYDVYEGNNKELVLDVCEKLGMEYEGAPFNVIGSQHFTGYADSIESTFDQFMYDAYDAQEDDIVAELIEKNNYKDLQKTTLAKAMKLENLKSVSGENSSNDGIILIAIFGAVIVLFGSLIFFSKRK